MPKQGTRDSHQRPIRALSSPLRHRAESLLIHNHLVVARCDETPREVLELLSRLNEEVIPGGNLDRNAGTRVAGPNVEAWIARTAVNGEEVKIGVKTREDGV